VVVLVIYFCAVGAIFGGFMEYKKVITSYDVWSAIRKNHTELKVFGSYSAPNGDYFGDTSQGKMITSYGFENSDYPIIEAETVWDIDREQPYKRINESHKYWLCIGIKDRD
jgi:hypothetical protein